MNRIKLCNRLLPDYTNAEEIMNMVTHIVGGSLGILALLACLIKAIQRASSVSIFCALVYGISLIVLYTMSSVYHGLRPCTGKKVMQIMDHCAIYLLIAGTYTPIALIALRSVYPALGWGMFLFQWTLAIVSIVLTAIDLKKYNIFSMICYIGMGWAILPFLPQAYSILGAKGFGFLLAGGIAYTVGAILYGIGSKRKWFHSVFHIFVVLGSFLQFICVYDYVI